MRAKFGPDLEVIRGRTTYTGPAPLPTADYEALNVQRQIDLHIDVMFIGGDPYIITVSNPIKYTHATKLLSRSIYHMRAALQHIIADYQSKLFVIENIYSDQELSLKGLVGTFAQQGIELKFVGSGSHVPLVERKIRSVKEKIRTILHSLPYKLSSYLLGKLVEYTVLRINSLP